MSLVLKVGALKTTGGGLMMRSWWWPEGYDVNQVSDWNDQSWYGYDWHVDGWQDDTARWCCKSG